MKTAYEALAAAQAEMTGAAKNAKNPHLKKSYADLQSVQDACLPALQKNGFAVYQPIDQDDRGTFVETIFAHSSGEVLKCRTPLIIGKNDMQGLGSAITYARRYGLMCMSGVAPEDDDGIASATQQRNDTRQHSVDMPASFEKMAPPPAPPVDVEEEALPEVDWREIDAKMASDHNVKLEECTTEPELKTAWTEIFADWKKIGKGPPVEVEKTKDTMKKKLKEETS